LFSVLSLSVVVGTLCVKHIERIGEWNFGAFTSAWISSVSKRGWQRRQGADRSAHVGPCLQIQTSLTAAKDFVAAENLRPFIMVEDAVAAEFADSIDFPEKECDSVLIGLCPSKFDYATVQWAACCSPAYQIN
jgi:hypothetical protein